MNSGKEPDLGRSGRNSFQEKGAAATKALGWKHVWRVQRTEEEASAWSRVFEGKTGRK